MDYQFSFNLLQQAQANFVMPHEAIGQWINEEVAHQEDVIEAVLKIISALQQGEISSHTQQGNALTLTMDRYEASFDAQDNDVSEDEDMDGMQLYNSEQHAGCGLEDFKQALEDWQRFIQRG